MNDNILKILRKNNQNPIEWDKVKDGFNADIAGYYNDEPVYKFFQTLTDDLEVTASPIAISVQPVESYIPFHVHNYVEIVVPIVGSCLFETRNGTVEIGEADIMIVGRGTIHRVHDISPETIVVNIALKPSAF